MNDKDTVSVLLLEDDADDRRLISLKLRNQRCRFDISWVESAAAAINALKQQSFDVVLTDLSVPDSHGLRTVARLREAGGQIPIIVMTSLDDDTVENDILDAGAQDYLVKGELDGRAVARAILHAVHRERSLNEVHALVAKLEQSEKLLQQQAKLLRKKNRRLKKIYQSAQEFVDNVSHDFRTPLTVIKDYVAIIREGMVGDVNHEQQDMLDRVAVRADDLNNMVDDLLDVSKLESGMLGAWRRNVDIHEIIERAECMLRQRANVRNVDLTVTLDPDIPQIYCDAEKVGRVIVNLAVNAIKFAGENGHVRLWVEKDPSASQVIIGVTDDGPGIDSQSLEMIFQRFQQLRSNVKNTVKGFGLGLNIAQQYCLINLGQLNVQSKVGEGSTFSFTIPYAIPTEVFGRWLGSQDTRAAMELVEITVDSDTEQAFANDLDNFFNCLLREDDLLVRCDPKRWLLVLAVTPSESDQWFRRAEKEFERHNHNRPVGQLPRYVSKRHHHWTEEDPNDRLLRQFDELAEQNVFSPVET